MTRYGDATLCPDCHLPLPVAPEHCPRCGLVLRGPLADELLRTLRTADEILGRLRAVPRPQPVPEGSPVAAPGPRPPQQPAVARGLPAVSVPTILLGLGALCLLVAAVTFLAVAWSWLGVGGRTAVLVGLTLVSGGLGIWFGRKDLRIAAESLTVVALGLLALDVVGADNAGWLGDLEPLGVLGAVGGALLVASLGLALGPRLSTPQLVAPFALTLLALGLLEPSGHPHAVVAATVLGCGALGWAGLRRRAWALPPTSLVVGTCWWLVLGLTGLGEAADHASLSGLWVAGHGWPLLGASVLPLLLAALARSRTLTVKVCAAVAATLVTMTAALPCGDESGTVLGLVAVATLVLWAAATGLAPPRWAGVAYAPLALAALVVLGVATVAAAAALHNAVGFAAPFTQPVDVRIGTAGSGVHPLLLPLCAAGLLLAALVVVPRSVRAAGLAASPVVLGLAVLGALASYDVPLWTLVAMSTALGLALTGDALRRAGVPGAAEASAGALALLLAVVLALPNDVLTSAAAAAVALGAAGALAVGRFPDADLCGGLLLPLATAGLVSSVANVAGVDPAHRGVPALLLVGALALAIPRPEVEVSAAVAAVVAASVAIAAGGTDATSLAVHLTVAGGLVSATALIHPSRRRIGWAGGLLLACATWVRLYDVGVEAPEPYTLPSAVALLVLGLRHLSREPGTSTAMALTPGLVLATTPSLLWVLDDPASPRAVVLGLACLVLVLGGARLRWAAPLVVGATVGALVVLRELAPYVARTPQWLLIGLAGTLLTVVGVTWERRLRDLRWAAGYLGRLR